MTVWSSGVVQYSMTANVTIVRNTAKRKTAQRTDEG